MNLSFPFSPKFVLLVTCILLSQCDSLRAQSITVTSPVTKDSYDSGGVIQYNGSVAGLSANTVYNLKMTVQTDNSDTLTSKNYGILTDASGSGTFAFNKNDASGISIKLYAPINASGSRKTFRATFQVLDGSYMPVKNGAGADILYKATNIDLGTQ